MEPLIFDEKYLAGGSEPNRDNILYSGTFNFDGREDLQSAILYAGDKSYNLSRWVDFHWGYDGLGGPDSPCSAFDLHIWRSGSSEFSYEILLTEAYNYGTRPSDTSEFKDSFSIVAKFGTGDDLSFSLPFSIICAPHYDSSVYEYYLSVPPNINFDNGSTVPDSVDWNFGGWENIYVPGDTRDPWRFQDDNDHSSSAKYSHPATHWGPTRDGSILLRVYEDALPQESMVNHDVEPRGYGIRNHVGLATLRTDAGLRSVKVLYDNQEYELKEWNPTDPYTRIDMPGGTLIFDEFTPSGDMACRFQLNENVTHNDPGIDVFNQKLTMQASFGGGSIATRDILVQIVDDAPFVRGDATMDLSSDAAWTLGGYKLPLSYDYLKDVLYRSTDYNDWATGFKVTNCEGKYGSIGVFGDDGNPDDPASAPGNTYYMPDPDKLAFIAPGETVTEAVQYTYTDSDGDTANGVLNIVLKGTGLDPSKAIDITPRPGNVPTSGGDVPADNPYVPGNPNDPDRDLTFPVAGDYDPMNPNWGLAKDGQPLLRVFESGLPNGSEAGQRNVTAHGYLDIDATVGLQSLVATTDGTDSYRFEDNMMAIPLDGGTLTLTQNPDENYLKYEFTLTDPVTHDTGNGINSNEQGVKLIAMDNFGNMEAIGLEVQIIDDVPKPQYDDIQIIECALPAYMYEWRGAAPDDLIYPWGFIGDKFNGGDPAWSVESYSIEPFQGKYGKIELSGNTGGTEPNKYLAWFDYRVDHEKIEALKSDEIVTEPFKYTYTDADGDSAEINAEIVIHGPGVRPNFRINEADLATGSELSIAGYEIVEPIIYDFNYKYGSISQDTDGIWRYKLSGSMNSDPVQGSNVTHIPNEIYMWVKDSKGFEMVMLADAEIIDSVPTFTASQNRLAYDFGADNGPGAGLKVAVGGAETDLVPGVETMIAGQHGLLTLSADGSCHYTPNSDAAGIDRFDFTIIDSDGDRALASIEASVQDGTPQLTMSVQDADSLAAIAALGVSMEAGGMAGA